MPVWATPSTETELPGGSDFTFTRTGAFFFSSATRDWTSLTFASIDDGGFDARKVP